jgi:hypothetical protein
MATPRQEIKFGSEIVTSMQLDKILQENGFSELHPPRDIYSTYCDTVCDSFLEANIEGHGYRKKVRLRHYQGDNIDKVLSKGVVLEEKSKYLTSTIKTRQDLDFNSYNIVLIHDPEYDTQVPIVLPAASIYPGLIARSVVAYRRRYYSDEKVRITVDDAIRFAQIDKFTQETSELFSLRGNIIIELKSGIYNNLTHYEKLVLDIPNIERTKMSKYVASRSFFDPSIDSFYPGTTKYGHAVNSK